MITTVSCPLCLHDRNLVDIEEDDHIASHLHSFSLRALPWDYELDDAAASAGSSGSSPSPGPPVPRDDLDYNEERDPSTFESLIEHVARLLKAVRDKQEATAWRAGLTQATSSQLESLLSTGLLWTTKLTRNQLDRCSSLFGRLQENLSQLLTEQAQSSSHNDDIDANIVLDIDEIEECLKETPRQDSDLWEEASKTLPDKLQAALREITGPNPMNSHSFPDQLNSLLKLAWSVQEKCAGSGQATDRFFSERIADALQQVANDESVILSPPANIPWAVILAVMEVGRS